MIISGGLNVYPKEIELLLDECDGVLESAVVGMPDTDFGERVVAFVVSSSPTPPAASDLLGALRESLAGFKLPKTIEFIPELPRNSMGKVQKAVLREP